MREPHPEADPDEVCIGNIWPIDFCRVGWQTKRLGKRALDIDGEPLRGVKMKPVFVKRREIEAAKVPIPDRGNIDRRW